MRSWAGVGHPNLLLQNALYNKYEYSWKKINTPLLLSPAPFFAAFLAIADRFLAVIPARARLTAHAPQRDGGGILAVR